MKLLVHAGFTALATMAISLCASSLRAETREPTFAGSSPATQVLARLDNPWGMAYTPDGDLLITEKPGRLRIWKDGKLSPPVSGVPTVSYRAQGGLLDVEVDPQFKTNRLVYLSYSEAQEQQPGGVDVKDARLGPFQELDDAVIKGLAVARGRLEGNRLTDVQVIWRAQPKTAGRNHFGGRLAFAQDGMLLISSGDRQRFEPAQDLDSDLGKIIRIRPDGSLPPDNPFAGGPAAQRDVWTLGHRNVLGLAVDQRNGRVYANEMGPLGGDEVNLIARGANYGWPLVSEGDHYDRQVIARSGTRPEFTAPLEAWYPSISPSGLMLYSGRSFPAWRGSLVFGGLSSQSLIRVGIPGAASAGVEVMPIGMRVRDVIQSPDGGVLLLSDGDSGALLRVLPASR